MRISNIDGIQNRIHNKESLDLILKYNEYHLQDLCVSMGVWDTEPEFGGSLAINRTYTHNGIF
jgi:hypothetical protein